MMLFLKTILSLKDMLKDIGYKKIDMKNYTHIYDGSWSMSTITLSLHSGYL